MSQTIHIANTQVEFEMASPSKQSLQSSLSSYPSSLQLQFLPLLYANCSDIVAVTAMPDQDYLSSLEQKKDWWPEGLPSLELLSEFTPYRGGTCHSWGPSCQVQEWANNRKVHYDTPNWSLAQQINSKAFSFRYTSLNQAALVFNEQELSFWLKKNPGSKVLKTCFGLAGQGNWRIDQDFATDELLRFCQKEWQAKRPIIAEPWLDRIEDFSTQWFIHPNRFIEPVGATRFDTDAKGVYQGTLAGPLECLFPDILSFLQEHCAYAQQALEEIAQLGFFGPIGIDAFIYHDAKTHKICLNPLVEINGRQTMSLVALRLQKRLCPDQVLRLSFQQSNHSQPSLLPTHLAGLNKKVGKFRRHLTVDILP